MRAANSWLGPDGQRAAIAGGRGVFCEKGLHGPVAADPQGDSYVQQLACKEDRPFSRYLLNRAGRDCAAADEQNPESALRTSIGRTLVRAAGDGNHHRLGPQEVLTAPSRMSALRARPELLGKVILAAEGMSLR